MNPAKRLLSQPRWTFSPYTFFISNPGRELGGSNDLQEPGNESGEQLPSPSRDGSGRTAVPRRGQDRPCHTRRERTFLHSWLCCCASAADPRFGLCLPPGPPNPGTTCSSQEVKEGEPHPKQRSRCKARPSKVAQKETWDAHCCF